jgi:hypothetical protein
VRIHLATEHAAEFQHPHAGFQLGNFPLDVGDGRRVVLGLGQLQQFGGIGQRRARGVQLLQVGAQPRPLASQLLRPFRLVPDILQFQFADDFFQTLFLGVVVKETPEGRRCARRGRAGSS